MVYDLLIGAFIDPQCQYVKFEYEDCENSTDDEIAVKEIWFPVEIITDIGYLKWEPDQRGYTGVYQNGGHEIDVIIEMTNIDCDVFRKISDSILLFIETIKNEKIYVDEAIRTYLYFEERERLTKDIESRFRELNRECRLNVVHVSAYGCVYTGTNLTKVEYYD